MYGTYMIDRILSKRYHSATIQLTETNVLCSDTRRLV
jgi:hypothetical protein